MKQRCQKALSPDPADAPVATRNLAVRSRDGLYKVGYTANPQNKTKSVRMTEEGLERARELFEQHFVRNA
jgi:hypothetical protein